MQDVITALFFFRKAQAARAVVHPTCSIAICIINSFV